MGKYNLTYTGPRMEVDVNKRMVFADVRVTEAGKELGSLHPAKFIYMKSPEAPVTIVSMLRSVREDLYLIVGTVNPESKVATFQIHVNPLVSWIWFGCIVLIFGSVVCMWPEVVPDESRAWAFGRSFAGIATSVSVGLLLALLPAPAYAQAGMENMHSGTIRIDNEHERDIFSSLRCMCGCPRDLLSTCTCDTRAKPRAKRSAAQIAAGDDEGRRSSLAYQQLSTASPLSPFRPTPGRCEPSTRCRSSPSSGARSAWGSPSGAGVVVRRSEEAVAGGRQPRPRLPPARTSTTRASTKTSRTSMAEARRSRKPRRARANAGPGPEAKDPEESVEETAPERRRVRARARRACSRWACRSSEPLSAVVVVDASEGSAPALLVLAGAALLATIAFFWASLRTLSGDAPLPEGMLTTATWFRAAPSEKKREVLRALKDLELEHSIGKIDDADYLELSTRYRTVAKTLMRAMDAGLAPRRERAESLAQSYLAEARAWRVRDARGRERGDPGRRRGRGTSCCGEGPRRDGRGDQRASTARSAASRTSRTPRSARSAAPSSRRRQ